MMKRLLLAALLVFPSALSAQPSDCSDGTVYDDGVFESGDGLNPVTVLRGGIFQLVEANTYPAKLNAACVCWRRQGSDTTIDFELGVWLLDGPQATPGTLVGVIPGLQATSVPTGGKFYRYNLASANLVISGPAVVGPIWRPRTDDDFFVCADETSGADKLRLEYIAGSSQDVITTPQGPINLATLTYALGIRPVFGAASACVPGPNRLCLNQGRFAVEATFTAPGQSPGTASVVKLTDETGYLWFFNSSNVEAVVKVLNACGLNQKFWVFAGGLTDVQVTLTVTDTQTGNSKTYTNPQGTAFRPIQDTAALSCQ